MSQKQTKKQKITTNKNKVLKKRQKQTIKLNVFVMVQKQCLEESFMWNSCFLSHSVHSYWKMREGQTAVWSIQGQKGRKTVGIDYN